MKKLLHYLGWHLGYAAHKMGLDEGHMYFVDFGREKRYARVALEDVTGWTLTKAGMINLDDTDCFVHQFVAADYPDNVKRLHEKAAAVGTSYVDWQGQVIYRPLSFAEANNNVVAVFA